MSIDDQPTLDSDLPAPPGELAAGSIVNGIYRLVRRLGAGGMGAVWEARHERTRGRVALKVLLPEMGRHEDVLRRFQREVEITSALNHPNVVRVSDADKLPDGRPFLVMEFLEGSDLAAAAASPLALPQIVEIVQQLAMGLQAAHGQGVIHRDLKPANIFLVPLAGTGRLMVKILDFGISKALDGLSKLTHTRSVVGTPSYMAPEQARAGTSSLDPRADQFSLAAIAYELITCRMAFDGDGMLNVLYKVVHEPPASFASLGVRVPDGVEAVVLRGLSKQADDRFATIMEFSGALEKVAAGGSIEREAAPGADALKIGQTKPLPALSVTTLTGSTGEIAGTESVAALAPAAPKARGRANGASRTGRRLSTALTVGGAGVVAAVIVVVAMTRASSPPAPMVATPVVVPVVRPAPPLPAPEHDKVVIGDDSRGTVIRLGESSPAPVEGPGDDQRGAEAPEVALASPATGAKPTGSSQRAASEPKRKPARVVRHGIADEAAVEGGQPRPAKTTNLPQPKPPLMLGPANTTL